GGGGHPRARRGPGGRLARLRGCRGHVRARGRRGEGRGVPAGHRGPRAVRLHRAAADLAARRAQGEARAGDRRERRRRRADATGRRAHRPHAAGHAGRQPGEVTSGGAGHAARPAGPAARVESLAQRFNQSQKDFEVKVEFVPQAQARQKLITSIAAGTPPDVAQVWDNWVGEFDGMNAVEDLTPKVRDWSGYKDVLPLAWETVTVKKRILSFPWVVTNDGVYWRTDRATEYGAKPPKDDWNFDDFLAYAKT